MVMQILKSAPCTPVLLGDRDYLHGTTMISELMKACRETLAVTDIQRISAQFHSLTKTVSIFELVDASTDLSMSAAGYVASFKIFTSNKIYLIGLRPTDNPLFLHERFDEDVIIHGYQLDMASQRIRLECHHPALVAVTVSLNKKLHSALFPEAGYSKWLMSRLDLNGDFFIQPVPCTIHLQLKSSLGFVNTKTSILVDGDEKGQIRFSRKKESA
jgi:hypothetical protein